MTFLLKRPFRSCLLSFVFLLITAGNSFADSNPYQIDDATDAPLRAGFHELYDLDFEKARAAFDSIQDKAEEHPLVALGAATVPWWRMSVDVTEGDPAESRLFLEAANRCIKFSIAKIKSGDSTGEAHLTLGSIYALLARWEAANRHWMAVYHYEKKARVSLKKALETNPGAVDANMALGIFDYTLSTLPKVVRVFSGAHGTENPSQGLRELKIAADNGIYLRMPATFFLVSTYSEDLKEPFTSVDILSQLRLEYPRSPFVDLMMFTALYNENCPVEMSVEAGDYAARVESGFYRPEFAAQADFFRALILFKSQDWLEAQKKFDIAVEEAYKNSPFKIWATLYEGYALDILGRREEALVNYRLVLHERPRWKSHEYAEKRMKRPFQATDPEVATLLL